MGVVADADVGAVAGADAAAGVGGAAAVASVAPASRVLSSPHPNPTAVQIQAADAGIDPLRS